MTKLSTQLKTGVVALAGLALLGACGGGDKAPKAADNSAAKAPAAAETVNPRQAKIDEAMAEAEKMIADAKATTGPGQPAMWTLADDDTTVYLFGTVHALPKDKEWRTPEFEQAFSASDKIVFELDLHSKEGQAAVGQAMLGAGMYTDGRTLTGVLNDEDEAIVADVMQGYGMPMAALDPVKPWFAALNLMNAEMASKGYDANSGVEMVLAKEAEAAGKSFDFLETADLQANVFAGLSEETQVDMLVESAMTVETLIPMLDVIVAEWSDGDVSGLGTVAANPDAPGDEAFYEALFVERNTDWVPKIEALLDEPGTVMVAVGAGHFAGPDSVITMLENKGHTVTRN